MIIPSNSLNTNTHSCALSHRVHILNEILVPHSQHTHPHPPKNNQDLWYFSHKINCQLYRGCHVLDKSIVIIQYMPYERVHFANMMYPVSHHIMTGWRRDMDRMR